MNEVNAWRQSGRLFLWRFTENVRNFPGWHFMLDAAGAVSIASLLRAMSRSGAGCFRMVQVSQPTAEVLRVPNNRSSGCEAPTRLRIELVSGDPDTWSLEDDGVALHWRLGSRNLAVVADACAHPHEYFDTSIGLDPPMWSWGVLAAGS